MAVRRRSSNFRRACPRRRVPEVRVSYRERDSPLREPGDSRADYFREDLRAAGRLAGFLVAVLAAAFIGFFALAFVALAFFALAFFGTAFFVAMTGSTRLPCAGASAVSRKRMTASVSSAVPTWVAPEIRNAGPWYFSACAMAMAFATASSGGRRSLLLSTSQRGLASRSSLNLPSSAT